MSSRSSIAAQLIIVHTYCYACGIEKLVLIADTIHALEPSLNSHLTIGSTVQRVSGDITRQLNVGR